MKLSSEEILQFLALKSNLQYLQYHTMIVPTALLSFLVLKRPPRLNHILSSLKPLNISTWTAAISQSVLGQWNDVKGSVGWPLSQHRAGHFAEGTCPKRLSGMRIDSVMSTESKATPFAEAMGILIGNSGQARPLCLPITALQTVRAENHIFLLAGQGPFLTIFDVNSHLKLLHERIFASQAIHGISCTSTTPTALLFSGGYSTRLAELTARWDPASHDHLLVEILLGEELTAEDWILDASLSATPRLQAWGLTANNVLLGGVCPWDGVRSTSALRLTHCSSGIRSILYSAQILPLSPEHVLIAAGTVFGDVVVWSCHAPSEGQLLMISTTHRILAGHKGSIFGLHISDQIFYRLGEGPRRLLVSSSDDRSIRIWDITSCDVPRNVENANVSRADQQAHYSGFGHMPGQSQLTMVWAHASRIWGVAFATTHSNSRVAEVKLVSRGEDATCQLWNVDLKGLWQPVDRAPLVLNHVTTDHHHSGKSIWSATTVNLEKQDMTVTGGADGRIVARSFDFAFEELNPAGVPKRQPCHDISATIDASSLSSIGSMPGVKSDCGTLRNYAFVSEECFIATTQSGIVLYGSIRTDKVRWLQHEQCKDVGPQAVLTTDTTIGVALMGSANGFFWLYRHSQQSIHRLTTFSSKISNIFIAGKASLASSGCQMLCLVVCFLGKSGIEVLWLSIVDDEVGYAESTVTKTAGLMLPTGFVLTSANYSFTSRILVLGSRAGALVVHILQTGKGSHRPADVCFRHIHGSDAVTSIRAVGSAAVSEPGRTHILTTGRDGTYAVHEVGYDELNDDCPYLKTVHRSLLPWGPDIEGAFFSRTSTSDTCSALILFGFRSKDFVVWNESRQVEVFSVACGGAHRSWCFARCPTDHASGPLEGGTFMWTKAGSVHIFRKTKPSHCIIQDGGHGREMKGVAISPTLYKNAARSSEHSQLVATGAEDTMIRLFVLSRRQQASIENPGEGPEFRCIRVIKKHTTGVQHLTFSSCGRYLFSCAGCEELYVWRIRTGVPGIDIGVVLVTALSRDDYDSDLRITHFDVGDEKTSVREEHDDVAVCFVVTAVYSNSMIKCFRFTCGKAGQATKMDLLHRCFYKTNCLTQISILGRDVHNSTPHASSRPFITASTDGHVTSWSAVEASTAPDQSNTFANISFRIHQNSIKALSVIELTAGFHLLVTGGDDNALGLSLMRTTEMSGVGVGATPKAGVETLLIPAAHAASITAVCILEMGRSASTVIAAVFSTGNDQRVKFWQVTVAADRPSNYGRIGGEAMEVIQVKRLGASWTSVADASAMAVLPDNDGPGDQFMEHEADSVKHVRRGARLLVVGVGMEVIHASFDLD